jgi:hypothetical protein
MFSKSKGEKVTKVKKSPIIDEWKINIVKEVIERKRIQGPGDPVDDGQSSGEQKLLKNRYFHENKMQDFRASGVRAIDFSHQITPI